VVWTNFVKILTLDSKVSLDAHKKIIMDLQMLFILTNVVKMLFLFAHKKKQLPTFFKFSLKTYEEP